MSTGGGIRLMFRIVAGAALLIVGASASIPLAYAEPAPAPPPQGPKTSFGDGIYAVGADIVPGVYQSAGPVEGGVCYWKRSNGDGTVANAMTKKPQTVQIEAGDTTFKSSECQDWQKTDAPPPAPPSPVDLIGQLGSLIGVGAAPGGS
jgi:hypothetical protein